MAEDIVRSLFGPTPDEVRQQQREKAYADSNAYGMMTHQARNIANERNTGYELGQTLGKMVGYVNPAEEKARQKQAILSRYDISTKDGQAQAMQAAKAMGRMDVVLELQQYDNAMQKEYYGLQKTKSEIEQNNANAEKRRRVGEFKNNFSKEYNNVLGEANRLFPNDPASRDQYITQHSETFMSNKNVKWGDMIDANGQKVKGFVNIGTQTATQSGGAIPILKKRTIGVEGKPKLAQDQEYDTATGKWVNVGGEYERHGAGVNVKVENITKPANLVAQFRKNVQDTVKPSYDIVTNADLGIGALKDSLATGNFIGFNAARGSIAKAMGDNHISAADIKAAGGDPSLVGGFVDYLNKLGTGTPSKDTQEKMLATLQLLKKIASKKANDELARQSKLGLMDKMSQEEVDAALDFPEFKSGTGNPTTQMKPAPAGFK